MAIDNSSVKGRGSQEQVHNRFAQRTYVTEHWEGIDEMQDLNRRTKIVEAYPKSIVNVVDSPDVPFGFSINPYQGCEHGCAYCYARPTHEYWGYSAGLDFEQVIIVKRNAPDLLRKKLLSKSWKPALIALSGATDPYQPVERKELLTRSLLEVLLDLRNPAGLISKNALMLRDTDLLQEMARMDLVRVSVSLTTLNEDLRRVMEPRTSTGRNRLHTVEALSKAGIPVHVMIAPIIPALNEYEVPTLLKAAADAGALSAGYTVLRANGAVGEVFRRWIEQHFPDRAEKVLAQVKAMHGGRMNDSRTGKRMRGEGAFAQNVKDVFELHKRKYFEGREMPPVNTDLFRRPMAGQLQLFDQIL